MQYYSIIQSYRVNFSMEMTIDEKQQRKLFHHRGSIQKNPPPCDLTSSSVESRFPISSSGPKENPGKEQWTRWVKEYEEKGLKKKKKKMKIENENKMFQFSLPFFTSRIKSVFHPPTRQLGSSAKWSLPAISNWEKANWSASNQLSAIVSDLQNPLPLISSNFHSQWSWFGRGGRMAW